jgi:hypothetical protein
MAAASPSQWATALASASQAPARQRKKTMKAEPNLKHTLRRPSEPARGRSYDNTQNRKLYRRAQRTLCAVAMVGLSAGSACTGAVDEREQIESYESAIELTGRASASSVESAQYGAEKAVDGNVETRWSSAFSDPTWLEVDLGEPHALERVVLDWEAAYSAEYQLQVSDDGKTFRSVHTERNSRAELDDIALTAQGRYVRVHSTRRGTAWGNSIRELRVFGEPLSEPPPADEPVRLPARIEAEAYVAHHDTSAQNLGDAACSSTSVDAQRTPDVDGACNIGWTDAGEWLDYDVSVEKDVTLDVVARLASNDAGRTIHLEVDGKPVGTRLVAPGKGWHAYADVSMRGLKLEKGEHVVRVVFDTGLVNLNWLSFALATPEPDPEPPTRAGCKRGVAYGYHSQADLRTMSAGIAWWYNWDQRPDSQVAQVHASMGVEFVPMVWGSAHVARADRDIPSTGMHTLLGFNEPNFHAQANMSPEAAARAWPELERIAKQKGITRIASPAVNYCGGGCWDTDPVGYLDRFFAECEKLGGCKVDVIAYHAYVCRLEWLTPKIEALYKYEKPIWLTEFACGDSAGISEDMQVAYMKDAVPWLEANPRIERYAWFAGRTDIIPHASLLAGSGALTRLGKTYLELPQNQACSLAK